METLSARGIEIEVAIAWPNEQRLVGLCVPAGSTVAAALEITGVGAASEVGVFGRRVPLEYVLKPGDRVELYRPLQADPKQARIRRAQRGV